MEPMAFGQTVEPDRSQSERGAVSLAFWQGVAVAAAAGLALELALAQIAHEH